MAPAAAVGVEAVGLRRSELPAPPLQLRRQRRQRWGRAREAGGGSEGSHPSQGRRDGVVPDFFPLIPSKKTFASRVWLFSEVPEGIRREVGAVGAVRGRPRF